MNSQLGWSIIRQFSCRNIYGFCLQDVKTAFPGKNRIYLSRILADMVSNGMLCKIALDIYHIPPLGVNPESYVPDGYQVAKYFMLNKEYYIGYASALKIHGLAYDSEDCVYVVTGRQKKPNNRSFGGTTYQFIYHDSNRFFGFGCMWINQLEKAMVSDLEKTIVDMATKPQLCRGIVEVGKILFQAKARMHYDKLFYYLARNRNMSAIKRILFLTEVLGLEWTADHQRMMKEIGSGFSLLDPSKVGQGRKRIKYGLKINVDPDYILNQVLNRNIHLS